MKFCVGGVEFKDTNGTPLLEVLVHG